MIARRVVKEKMREIRELRRLGDYELDQGRRRERLRRGHWKGGGTRAVQNVLGGLGGRAKNCKHGEGILKAAECEGFGRGRERAIAQTWLRE